MNEVINTAWEKSKGHDLGPTLAARTKAMHPDLHHWGHIFLKGPRIV